MTSEKIQNLVQGLKKFFEKTGFSKGVVGLSGGVDSALVAKLAVEAIGASNVTALILPFNTLTNPQNTSDAEAWAKELGIQYEIIPINDFTPPFTKLPWKENKLASMNIKARARANILYHYANTHDALVLGTGNKTEALLGYFTKYGDGAVDILPIGDLYKTEVWEAARLLGLPKVIIDKKPTAELEHGQTDEGEIGVSYAEMDAFLKEWEKDPKKAGEKNPELLKRIQLSEHKRHLPPILKAGN